MALKKLILIALLLISAELSFGQNQDSVIFEVFNFLTGDAVTVTANADKFLEGPEWEALAYWDSHDPKELKYMQEAVGDIYQFISTSFTIKTVNPDNPADYLPAITGTFKLTGNTIILTSQSGKQLQLNIILLDQHYLILEMDGLRIFFTQTRSYQGK